MNARTRPLELADVQEAARRLAGVAHRTPVLTSRTLDKRTGARVHVKVESFQRGGAFKFRGAYTKISSLPPTTLERGVLAYSSGNHAQGVALDPARLYARRRPVRLDLARDKAADLFAKHLVPSCPADAYAARFLSPPSSPPSPCLSSSW